MSGASSQLIRDTKLPSAILICAVLLALYTSARIKYVFPTRPLARDEECRAVEVGAENSPCFQGPFRCFITFQMTFSMPAADDPGTGILARSVTVLQCKSAVFVVFSGFTSFAAAVTTM
jgi:hypothetical protein